jgi:hypothetical protein
MPYSTATVRLPHSLLIPQPAAAGAAITRAAATTSIHTDGAPDQGSCCQPQPPDPPHETVVGHLHKVQLKIWWALICYQGLSMAALSVAAGLGMWAAGKTE